MKLQLPTKSKRILVGDSGLLGEGKKKDLTLMCYDPNVLMCCANVL